MTFNKCRRLFPVTRRLIYFNHASNGPLSLPARRALEADLKLYSQQADFPVREYFRRLEQARTAVAGLLSATAAEIAFTANTSHGIYLALGSLSLTRGDRVIIMDEVFPTVRCCVDQNWPEIQRIYVQFRGRDPIAAVKSHINKRTRAVIVDWVNYFTGEVLDLDRLGSYLAERSVRFVVDGMQGVGALKLDLSKTYVDYLATGGSKWLFSGQGIGFLYVNRKNFQRLTGSPTGWLGRQWRDFININDLPALYPDARRLEMGTRNALLTHALAVNARLLQRCGMDKVENRIRELVTILRRGLTAMGCTLLTPVGTRISGILTAVPPGAVGRVYRHLTRHRVALSLRNQALRFSPHFYNHEDEVREIIRIMKRALS